jgi:hypothetical protein
MRKRSRKRRRRRKGRKMRGRGERENDEEDDADGGVRGGDIGEKGMTDDQDDRVEDTTTPQMAETGCSTPLGYIEGVGEGSDDGDSDMNSKDSDSAVDSETTSVGGSETSQCSVGGQDGGEVYDDSMIDD